MTNDSNPNQPSLPPEHEAGDHLSRVLHDLVEQAPFRQRNTDASVNDANEKCPDIADWLRLACGEATPEEKEALLAHAALCTSCLATLRECQRVFTTAPSPEETVTLQNAESSSPGWQRRLALELASTPRKPARFALPRLFAWTTAGAAAAVAATILMVVFYQRQHAPEHLLAEAYSQSRTFDLRVPGARFASITPQAHLRGGAVDTDSPALLTARAEIQEKLQKNPSDSHWLQLEARADVMDERYDAAVDILDRLVASGPVTSGLLLDDGSAYFLRGIATGSENDRATALEYLRRADELDPSDPVVLFNEALVMEDRGQLMNAVETWNRYLQFETDPKWQAEGRSRLAALQQKLDRLKTHESRMELHLATPQAMRALAADPSTLAGIDEELSTTFLPRLLDTAFPLPVDRSRGSPCNDSCQAARTLLLALAASLQHNHQDLWLTQFLPSDSSPIPDSFVKAAHALGRAVDDDTHGNYTAAENWSLDSSKEFVALGNRAGIARAEVERAFALQREFMLPACHEAAAALVRGDPRFTWIQAQAVAIDSICNSSPGTSSADNPEIAKALDLALAGHYVLLELRARNGVAGFAIESGDAENAWRLTLETLRRFYSGDYPPFRAATLISGLSIVEESTPRVQLELLLARETFGLFALSKNKSILEDSRASLICAALRAGAMSEANQQLAIARRDGALGSAHGGQHSLQAEAEIGMAQLYLQRGDLKTSQELLEDAHSQMAGEDNTYQLRSYAEAQGQLQLALGDPRSAEATLHNAILQVESEASGAGVQNIAYARRDRNLYADLSGIWLAEKRPAADILSLWERYRLRILGRPVPACPHNALDCLRPQLEKSLRALGASTAVGQIVLWDRTLTYTATAGGVAWKQTPLAQADLLTATARLEQAASTPASSQASVDEAARRVGNELFGNQPPVSANGGNLLLEPDPLLGNVPWPAVESAQGPLGLQFNLEESPSLLLEPSPAGRNAAGTPGHMLVVGASEGAGQSTLLPEVLREARAVARFSPEPELLLSHQATEQRVLPLLQSASILHFAGHAAEFDGNTRLLLAPSSTPGDKPYLDKSVFERTPPRAAQLVVFDACSSGKQEAGWDHGMGDIVDTLTSLGVPEVVATRWRIDSATAVPMMDAFYRGLAGGQSVPQALTAARQSLIRDARFRHPYYWAAYYASGEGTTDLREVLDGSSR